MNKPAIAVFAFLGVIWGSNFLFVKTAAAFISPLQITLLRVLFGFLPVLLYALATGALRREHWKHAHHFLVMSLLATALYYFAFAVFICVSLLLWRLIHSPFGRVVKAIKQNETRARFVGYDVWRYKAAVLVLSAALSGLAGGLFAMAQASAFPDVMSLHYSGYVVMMTLVGGRLVSFWGPVIGAVAFR